MVVGWVTDALSALVGWLSDAILWLLEGVLWVFMRIVDGMLLLLDLIPVPGFISDIGVYYASLMASPMGYFLDVCQVEYGFQVLVVAWGLRFAIRRLPVIG